ncbi:MAG TPA: hypothetical protein VFV14_07265 [Myxococcaceae bacterium]|nr:hypothetical protein [Myxococcaceae bacterium]
MNVKANRFAGHFVDTSRQHNYDSVVVFISIVTGRAAMAMKKRAKKRKTKKKGGRKRRTKR